MKKAFLLLSLLLVSAITFAQVSFKTDGGFHGGFSFGEVSMYGFGASLEPKVFIRNIYKMSLLDFAKNSVFIIIHRYLFTDVSS